MSILETLRRLLDRHDYASACNVLEESTHFFPPGCGPALHLLRAAESRLALNFTRASKQWSLVSHLEELASLRDEFEAAQPFARPTELLIATQACFERGHFGDALWRIGSFVEYAEDRYQTSRSAKGSWLTECRKLTPLCLLRNTVIHEQEGLSGKIFDGVLPTELRPANQKLPKFLQSILACIAAEQGIELRFFDYSLLNRTVLEFLDKKIHSAAGPQARQVAVTSDK